MKRIHGVLLLLIFCSCYSCSTQSKGANSDQDCNSEIRSWSNKVGAEIPVETRRNCEQSNVYPNQIDQRKSIDHENSRGLQSIDKNDTQEEKAVTSIKVDPTTRKKDIGEYIVIGEDYDPEQL